MARVLVVEDDEFVRTLITHILKEAGHDIYACEDGAQAIEHMWDKKYDMVVTDIRMPNEDGTYIADHVRNHHLNIPVLAVSSCDENDIGYMDFSGHFSADILRKPFTKDDLLATVDRLLASEPA